MPSNPASLEKVTRVEISMKLVAVLTIGSLLKTRTRPPCSTTNQRVLSPGACIIATGFESVTPENTCSISTVGVVGGSGIGFGMPPPLEELPPPHALSRSAPLDKAIQRLNRKLVIGRSSCNVRGISSLHRTGVMRTRVSVGIVRQPRWR